MFSLNRVQLIGYVTQLVELRQTPSGQSVADLNVAVPYSFNTDSGQTLSGTSYHSVTAWGGMAEVAAQYLKPGSQLFLSGRLQTDTWEDQQSGEKRSKTRVVAMDLIMLDPRDGQIDVDASGKSVTNCLNRADVIGNLTRDPEMRTTTSGQNVLSLGVATNERWRDKASNEMKERVEFHNIVVWGDLAQTCQKHLKKGRRVHVSGRVQTRSWETQQGTKRYTTEITADTISLLGVKNTDIVYSNESREQRMARQGQGDASTGLSTRKQSTSPESTSKKGEVEPTPVVASGTSVPEIKYESDVKAKDLPF